MNKPLDGPTPKTSLAKLESARRYKARNREEFLSIVRELRAYRKEGWVLVPKVPTGAMLKAARHCRKGLWIAEEWTDPVYRAMIAAAPEPQEEPC